MIKSALHHPAGRLRNEHVAKFERLPLRFQPAIQKRWLSLYAKGGLKPANTMLLDAGDALTLKNTEIAQSDGALRDFAKARAAECFRMATRLLDADLVLAAMEKVATDNGVLPPDGKTMTASGRRARLLSHSWWTRALRKSVGRTVERAAINLGMVHRYAGLYASNETVARRKGQKTRNRKFMESMTAINSDGQEFNMQALADLGISNPKIRRMELMTRLAGFDAIAKASGHAAEFYTLTAPSKYHARGSVKGEGNEKFNGCTPRQTQSYLTDLWARIRAALHRREIRFYGFRVCEPHHDGTPHWHMVLFMELQHAKTVRKIFNKYALEIDGNEAGASEHRFTAKAIDRSQGSAAGYLAKYISKNIDGFGVGEDWEAVEGNDSATISAARVDAWASCWGIRQFQQVGGAPVTVWRELRRLDAASVTGRLQALVMAADVGDWAQYVELMGGAFAKRVDFPLACHRVGGVDLETGEITFNAYGEIAAPVIKGLEYAGEVILTHVLEWVFERRAQPAAPWSSVNNCTEKLQNTCSAPYSADENARKGRVIAWVEPEKMIFSYVDWQKRGWSEAENGKNPVGVSGYEAKKYVCKGRPSRSNA